MQSGTTTLSTSTGAPLEKFSYDNKIVKFFIIATVSWGLVGMLVGLTIAIQLFYPALNLDLQYTTFGRLRPLHTNAVIFAFVGNGIFTGVYYSMQRLLKTRMYSDLLSWLCLLALPLPKNTPNLNGRSIS